MSEYMTRKDALAYLTGCADRTGTHYSGGVAWQADDCPTCGGTNEAGHLAAPCSRYGHDSTSCAQVAYRFAYLVARQSGTWLDEDALDHAMTLVVNDHDDVADVIRAYGYRHYT